MSLYEELVNSFNIKKGESIWLASEVLKLSFVFRKAGTSFDPEELIRTFEKAVGEEGTLLIPSFSWEFSNHGVYDVRTTKPTTGSLSETAMHMPEFKRTKHPMHSFLVYGKDQELLCGMENIHSFGEDSPFGYCQEKNVRQIMLGTDYTHGMTYVHFVETKCEVPYRFTKEFTGSYTDENGHTETKKITYAARRLDVGTVEEFNRIGEILEEKGVAKESVWKGIVSHEAYLGDSDPIIAEDILNNQCRNIYDFQNASREELFADYHKASL